MTATRTSNVPARTPRIGCGHESSKLQQEVDATVAEVEREQAERVSRARAAAEHRVESQRLAEEASARKIVERAEAEAADRARKAQERAEQSQRQAARAIAAADEALARARELADQAAQAAQEAAAEATAGS